MGSQTVHGIPYPVGSDRVMDGDNAIQALAESVDVLFFQTANGPGNDTGWVPLNLSPGWAAVPGYALQTRRVGSFCSIRGMVKFVSGLYTGTICVIPDGMRPAVGTWLGTTMGTNNPRIAASFLLANTGVINIPSATYVTTPPAVNDQFPFHWNWMTG
jgi:hypothetical protein